MVKTVKETGFVVEKILDKRITAEGKIEYYIKWRGYPVSESTWEPDENCDCPAIIQKFEESRAKSKKRGEKKPKIEEIQKPRGYDRGLVMEQIVGATDVTGSINYLVKWEFCDEYDLVSAEEVRQKNPELLIAYYESRSTFKNNLSKRLVKFPQHQRHIVINEAENDVMKLPTLSNSGATEAAVSYSIPVPGVGNIAIDVPILGTH